MCAFNSQKFRGFGLIASALSYRAQDMPAFESFQSRAKIMDDIA